MRAMWETFLGVRVHIKKLGGFNLDNLLLENYFYLSSFNMHEFHFDFK